jgi:peptide/nickel transport system ATP-binding protein
MSNLLEVRNLTKVFSAGTLFKKRLLKAVDNVSFEMPKDRATITTAAGESGSGKSTIAKLLLMLEKPTSGEIIYDGKNLQKISKKGLKIYRKDVQAVFQDPYDVYNPIYKIDRVLEMPFKTFGLSSSREEERKIILDCLNAVNISPETVLGKYAHQLSGGERQRIMFTRALLTRPKLIVADEPVSMIDASVKAGILNLMLDLKENYRLSFFYITHDLSTAYSISDNIIMLYRGSVVERGKIKPVIEKPCHPYVQGLIDSIPVPDPEKRWKEDVNFRTEEVTYVTSESGCKFYHRCPKKMDKCLTITPQISSVEPDHAVACHLYSD